MWSGKDCCSLAIRLEDASSWPPAAGRLYSGALAMLPDGDT